MKGSVKLELFRINLQWTNSNKIQWLLIGPKMSWKEEEKKLLLIFKQS